MQLTEMHPSLYDNTKHGYSRWDVTSKAWEEVAKKINDTGK
jgi:hypothetical protein